MVAHKRKYHAFLLSFMFIIPLGCLPDPEQWLCSIIGNYTAAGEFAKNLNQVLLYLNTTTPTTGFSINTAGVGPSKVFGLALCREDASYENCRTCVGNAIHDAIHLCPGSMSMELWYTYCWIRYKNSSFDDTIDESDRILLFRVSRKPQAKPPPLCTGCWPAPTWRPSWSPPPPPSPLPFLPPPPPPPIMPPLLLCVSLTPVSLLSLGTQHSSRSVWALLAR